MKSLFLSIMLFASCAIATAQYKAPPYTSSLYVQDDADILSPMQEQSLHDQIVAIRNQASIEMVIVTLKDLDGYEIEEVGLEIGRSWGVGKSELNNGLVYVICPSLRKGRIEVGYGLEGDLPDIVTQHIQDDMKPSYREEKYYEGMLILLSEINKYLSPAYKEQQRLYEEQQRIRSEKTARTLLYAAKGIGLVILFLSFVAFILHRHKKKEEKRREEEERLLELEDLKASIIVGSEIGEKQKSLFIEQRRLYLAKLGLSSHRSDREFESALDEMTKKYTKESLDKLDASSLSAIYNKQTRSYSAASEYNSALAKKVAEHESMLYYIGITLPILSELMVKARLNLTGSGYDNSFVDEGVGYIQGSKDPKDYFAHFKNYVQKLNYIISWQDIEKAKKEEEKRRQEEEKKRKIEEAKRREREAEEQRLYAERRRREEEEEESRRRSSSYSSSDSYSSSGDSSSSGFSGGDFGGGGSSSSW